MQKEIILSHSKLLLDRPAEKSTYVILFLPGISGGAFSPRFQPLVDVALSEKYAIARMEAWKDAADVETKTLNELHRTITEALEALKQEGFEKVVGIGKSFGGGLFLSYHSDGIIKKILWAPAITVATKGNFDEINPKKLGELAHLTDVQISKDFVATDPAEIDIIHGTKDEVVPLENSRNATDAAARGNLKIIEGADHSFKTAEDQLMEATRRFLVVE